MKEEENVYEETTRSEDATAVEGEKASTVPGKFKDVDALVRAYSSLQAEFTRRSQKLKELEKRGLSNVRFVLTLKKEHYDRIFGEEYTDKVVNVGPIPAAECPSLYEECDYMFLPTLLECFSASYAEAMIMEKPILTSNLGFATVVCKDAAVYFDAINPIDIADKIERLVTNPALQRELIEKGKKQLSQFGTAEDRANQILELCRKISK